MDGPSHTAGPRHAASGPALRSANPLTPGRPARNGEYGRRRQVSWLACHRQHRLPRPAAQWHSMRLFAHSCGGSSGLAEIETQRPVFPLSPVERDKTPSAERLYQIEMPPSQSLWNAEAVLPRLYGLSAEFYIVIPDGRLSPAGVLRRTKDKREGAFRGGIER